MALAGIILCGGQSRRMGLAKADLPFGRESMLNRVVRLVGEAVERVVVVAAVDQQIRSLDKLPSGVELVRDRRPDCGPLEGLGAGLRALDASFEAAFATSCDVPLLVPDFIRRLHNLAADHDAAVPRFDSREHPLSAVYRASVLPTVEQLLAAERLRMFDLVAAIRTRNVEPAEFADVDPHGFSLQNVNRPEDYRAALAEAGFGPSPCD